MNKIDKVILDAAIEEKTLNLVDHYTRFSLGEVGAKNINIPALGNYLLGDTQTFENRTTKCPFLGFLPDTPCRICDSLFPRVSGPIEHRCPCIRGYSTQAITDVITKLLEAYKSWTPPKPIEEKPVDEPIEELPIP
jgi:hypothetical protein